VELKLSAGAAQYRKSAAELIQRFPAVEAALRDGRLCLSSVIEVAKVLTPENQVEVLPRFFGLSSRDAAFVAASIRPVENAPRREVLVPVRLESSAAPAAAPLLAFRAPEVATVEAAQASAGAPEPIPPPSASVRPTPPKPSTFEPLDAERGRLHLTVSLRLHRKIEAARNAQPGATTEEILETALDALLTQRAKRKGIGVRPRKTPRPAGSDTTTAEVTRALYERSGGRCEWIFESGERCNSPVLPERDHIQPRGRGGPTTFANLRICCKPHNNLAARQVYGDKWMDRFMKRRKPGDSDPSR
jgi:hypothetical protein